MRRRAQLEALAAAGDFGVASDRTSARISMAVSALADPETSPLTLPEDDDEACVVLYEHALAVLSPWLDDPGRCRQLWGDEDAELDAAERALAAGGVRIQEHPAVDLAVVTLPVDPAEGRHHLTCRYEGWVQFRSRRTAPSDLTPELATDAHGPGSDLDCQRVAAEVIRFLADASPAWDPYAH